MNLYKLFTSFGGEHVFLSPQTLVTNVSEITANDCDAGRAPASNVALAHCTDKHKVYSFLFGFTPTHHIAYWTGQMLFSGLCFRFCLLLITWFMWPAVHYLDGCHHKMLLRYFNWFDFLLLV